MTQNFLQKMTSRGYSEAEAQTQWDQAMAKAENGDPIYETVSEMHQGNEEAAREDYALSQIEGLPVKSAATSVSSDPMQNDSGASTGSNLPAPTASKSSGGQSTKYTPPSIDDDSLRQQMNDAVTALLAEKTARTAATSIARVLVKTPDPSTFLKDGAMPKKVTISTAMEKITKFETSLEGNDDNLKAYQMLKAAAEGKTPVDVYINDENNRRIIGVVIDTTGDNGEQTKMILSSKNLEAFLLGQVSGIITNGQAYVRLANWKKKTKMEGGQPNTTISLTVQWTKKGFFWENNMVDFIAAPMTKEQAAELGAPSPFESRTVKTALSFTVVEPNPNPITRLKTPMRKRKIRLSGSCEDFPRFALRPEYENQGLSIGSSTTFISPNMTSAEAAIHDQQFHALVKGYMGGENFTTQVETLAKVAPGAYSRLLELRQSAREQAKVPAGA